jgi:hypothetical protein
MNSCSRIKTDGLVVVTDQIRDGHFLAYRVNEHGAIDFNHIGFGHGTTRDEAIIDLYRRTK